MNIEVSVMDDQDQSLEIPPQRLWKPRFDTFFGFGDVGDGEGGDFL